MSSSCTQTTSSVDGTIRVWQLDAGTEPTCVQVIDGLITAEDAECVHLSPLETLERDSTDPAPGCPQLGVLGRGHLASGGQVLRRREQGQRCVASLSLALSPRKPH